MQIHRNEVTTGLLVLIAMGILGAALVVISMPGVIYPMKTFHISFDNASGLHPGDPVLLAGRKIGEVTALESPVPMARRPEGHPDYEVLIEVKVDKDARVRSEVIARLYQQGLMGQQVIDFIQGDETSPIAPDHSVFVGERVPQIAELAAIHLERLTGENSDLSAIMRNTRQLSETVKREPWRLIWKK
jgi:ABC-type transporter Mla subunit MlaD